ncbi:bifunctional MaoC family dehydratase N-terminal/OB-fold nucleic acid binding domain-containing protein [Streptomyces lydicamycinicus]|uniref:bifunctional MaoC family dehydratase N-terminal/OB-fold nucleic acid binding domain-containing protein n=1 Tax=Streptomyces lydicamycinicus TaxID=1546107 RepID=UPI003C2D35F8
MNPVRLAYEQLKTYEGRPTSAPGVGKDLVNEPMIRHWCEAVGDTNPAYQGPDAVAPPTMLQAWTMGGLSGHADRSGAYDELSGLLDSAGYTSIVATDCEQEYLRPLRPGDRITFDSVIESVSECKTTKLGVGHFITTRMDIRADGEPAGTHRFRVLKYAPAARLPKTDERPPETDERPPETVGQPQSSQSSQHPRPRRPRPVINRDNAGFWEGVRGHRLLIQRCTGCRTLRFPWLPGCNTCGSPEWDTVEASGAGTVFSYVVMHHPPFPAFTVADTPADGAGPDATAPGATAPGATAPGAADSGTASPYAVGLIELAEGVRMVSNIVGVPYDKVRIGMPVRLEFLCADEELELPVFRVAEGGEG